MADRVQEAAANSVGHLGEVRRHDLCEGLALDERRDPVPGIRPVGHGMDRAQNVVVAVGAEVLADRRLVAGLPRQLDTEPDPDPARPRLLALAAPWPPAR